MSSAFEAQWSGIAEPLLDAQYGEAFHVFPKSKPDVNARALADPARPPMALIAIWSDPHTVAAPLNRSGHPVAEGQKFGNDKPTIDYTTSALPYVLVIGDEIVRVCDGTRYAVSDPGTDGFTRSTAALTAGRGRM